MDIYKTVQNYRNLTEQMHPNENHCIHILTHVQVDLVAYIIIVLSVHTRTLLLTDKIITS